MPDKRNAGLERMSQIQEAKNADFELVESGVRGLIEHELSARDEAQGRSEEPEVAFTVRLPVSNLEVLEQLSVYLGYKKTRFASFLLQSAIEEALHALVEGEEMRGRGNELEEFLQKWEPQDSGD